MLPFPGIWRCGLSISAHRLAREYCLSGRVLSSIYFAALVLTLFLDSASGLFLVAEGFGLLASTASYASLLIPCQSKQTGATEHLGGH